MKVRNGKIPSNNQYALIDELIRTGMSINNILRYFHDVPESTIKKIRRDICEHITDDNHPAKKRSIRIRNQFFHEDKAHLVQLQQFLMLYEDCRALNPEMHEAAIFLTAYECYKSMTPDKSQALDANKLQLGLMMHQKKETVLKKCRKCENDYLSLRYESDVVCYICDTHKRLFCKCGNPIINPAKGRRRTKCETCRKAGERKKKQARRSSVI